MRLALLFSILLASKTIPSSSGLSLLGVGVSFHLVQINIFSWCSFLAMCVRTENYLLQTKQSLQYIFSERDFGFFWCSFYFNLLQQGGHREQAPYILEGSFILEEFGNVKLFLIRFGQLCVWNLGTFGISLQLGSNDT